MSKLLVLSALAHCVVFIFIIFQRNDGPLRIDISQAIPLDVSFQVMPFVKKSCVSLAQAAAAHSDSVSAKPSAPALPGVSFGGVVKTEKGTTKGRVKNNKKISEKKELVSKRTKKKEAIDKKHDSKKADEVKKIKQSQSVLHEEKKIQPSLETSSKPVAQQPNQSAPSISATDKSLASLSGDLQSIYIGREEYEVLAVYRQIQHDVQQLWKPPVGINPDCFCTLLIDIGKEGKVLNAAVQESSGIVPYDIAARLAVSEVEFPQHLQGKQVLITFKQ
jgi:hypothetical protein